jgi:hypothetical protein
MEKTKRSSRRTKKKNVWKSSLAGLARKKASQSRKFFSSTLSPRPRRLPINFHLFLLPVSKVHSPLEIHRLPASCFLHCSSSRRENAEIYLLRSLPFFRPRASEKARNFFSCKTPRDQGREQKEKSSGGVGGVQKMFTTFPRTQKRNLISLQRRG